MKRIILRNEGASLCFLLSGGTVCAQDYPWKVKNAQEAAGAFRVCLFIDAISLFCNGRGSPVVAEQGIL